MQRVLLVITDELFDAIEEARGEFARNPWLEAALRQNGKIKKAAKEHDIKFPERELRRYEYTD